MAVSGVSPSVVAISGSDPLLIIEALQASLAEAGIDPVDSFDHVDLDGIETSAAEILQSATTIPFLSPRRSVVVRRADRLGEADVDALSTALPTIPASGLIVFVFEPLGDAAKGAALKSAAKKAGRLIEVKSPDRSVIITELKKRAGEAGLLFDRDAAEKMCDLVGSDLSEAVSELGKIIAACSSTGKVTVDDVKQIVIPSQEYRVFLLLDAVCEGQLGPALTQLGRLLSAMPKAEDAAMRNVLPQMHKQLLNIFQARALLDERVSLDSPDAKRYLSEAYSLANANDFPRKKATAFARRLSLAQVAALLRLVLETDMRLKGQLPQATAEETLERMLAEMCLIVRDQT